MKLEYKAFDIETTGLDSRKSEIFSYCVGDTHGNVDVCRVDGQNRRRNWKRLQDFFADETISKVCHNYHFELAFLRAAGIKVAKKTVWHDTMFMSQLLRNLAPSHALDYLCWELCGYTRKWDIEVKKRFPTCGRNYANIPRHIMDPYQRADGQRTMMLFLGWFNEIKSDERLFADYQNEIELVKATIVMEEHGIQLDDKEAIRLIKWLKKKFKCTQNATQNLLGERANLNSSIQLSKILFTRFGFDPISFSEKGQPSTDKDALMALKEKYDNGIFDLILQWRSYSNGITTIKKYIELADDRRVIHPNIKTNQARTSRESSENPNVNNIAKSSGQKNPYAVPARRCFRCAPKHVLLFADYSQIELRLIMDAAGDEIMFEILNAGGDVHREALECFHSDGDLEHGREYAAELQKRDPKKFKDVRSACKNGHFALGYGAGLLKIATTIDMSMEKLKPGYDLYRERHPKIVDLINIMSRDARRTGYVTTPFGRKLNIIRNEAYAALNYYIQGTAAGVFKRGQVRIWRYIRRRWNDEIKMVIPNHDEIVFDYPRTRLDEMKEAMCGITKRMITMEEIRVRLDVEWKMSTTTWDKAKEVEIGTV